MGGRRVVRMEPRAAAKRVIVGIIQEAGGKFERKLALNKAFYYAHLHFWREGHGVLSHYPIVKLPMGPAIDKSDSLLGELSSEGLIEITLDDSYVKEYGQGEPQQNFRLVSGHTVELTVAEREAIKVGIDKVKDLATKQITSKSHGRSWDAAKMGKRQDIYLDAMNEEEFQKLSTLDDETITVLNKLFGNNK